MVNYRFDSEKRGSGHIDLKTSVIFIFLLSMTLEEPKSTVSINERRGAAANASHGRLN